MIKLEDYKRVVENATDIKLKKKMLLTFSWNCNKWVMYNYGPKEKCT